MKIVNQVKGRVVRPPSMPRLARLAQPLARQGRGPRLDAVFRQEELDVVDGVAQLDMRFSGESRYAYGCRGEGETEKIEGWGWGW